MSEVTRCSECAFMAWDGDSENFICARTLDRHPVSPSQPPCTYAIHKVYHKRSDRTLAYQLDLFERPTPNLYRKEVKP